MPRPLSSTDISASEIETETLVASAS